MTNIEETKRIKARNMRYKKPIVNGLNLDDIRNYKGGEMLGFDTYEGNYYGLGSYESRIANEEAVKKIKSLTKDQLIEAIQCCFGIYQAYIGLRYRYDCIKSAMDILRSENTSYLKMIKQIEDLYEKANEETEGFKYDYFQSNTIKSFDRLLENIPQEAWIQ